MAPNKPPPPQKLTKFLLRILIRPPKLPMVKLPKMMKFLLPALLLVEEMEVCPDFSQL
jgi:hypothetical protein